MYRQPRSGFTRIPYVQRCQVRIGGRTVPGLVCNISVLGLYLHLENLPEVGTRVTVEFTLPDGGPPVAAEATVTWTNAVAPERVEELPPGCGLRFVTLAPDEVRRLASLVAAFVATPRPLPGRVETRGEKVRIPFVAPCVVSGLFGPHRGTVCNLSREGVYVGMDTIPELGEAVIVGFHLPGTAEAFERIAVVAWRNPEGPGRVHALPPGCGLRFASLLPDDGDCLGELVDTYTGALPPAAESAS